MAKKRSRKKAKKKTKRARKRSGKPGGKGSPEPINQPMPRTTEADEETPRRLPPPCVSWRDDSHAQKARGPKRVRRRIERIAKCVWRNIPDREQRVIDLAPHDILLMSGPVGGESLGRPVDDVSNSACWHEKLGILLNVESEASDPHAEKRFTYFVAHELAHAYLKSASLLIRAGASSLSDVEIPSEHRLPQLKAIAAAYGPGSERDRGAEEIMVTTLAISWGFGSQYLVSWLLEREAKALREGLLAKPLLRKPSL